MPNYNIRELQLHIKEMLMAFHNICKEHDLHYYIKSQNCVFQKVKISKYIWIELLL